MWSLALPLTKTKLFFTTSCAYCSISSSHSNFVNSAIPSIGILLPLSRYSFISCLVPLVASAVDFPFLFS